MENFEWLFGGIGVAVIGWLFFNRSNISQKQKSGDNSTNIQVGGDYKPKGK